MLQTWLYVLLFPDREGRGEIARVEEEGEAEEEEGGGGRRREEEGGGKFIQS